MCCNKKEEQIHSNDYLMLLPLVMWLIGSFPQSPKTVINIYSDKKIEVKDNE